MKTYKIVTKDIFTSTITVKAESAEEAANIVQNIDLHKNSIKLVNSKKEFNIISIEDLDR